MEDLGIVFPRERELEAERVTRQFARMTAQQQRECLAFLVRVSAAQATQVQPRQKGTGL